MKIFKNIPVFFGAAVLTLSLSACKQDPQMELLHVKRGYLVQPIGAAPSVMYIEIVNPTDSADTLLSVSSDISSEIEMHEEMKHTSGNGDMPVDMVHMMPVKSIEIAGKSSFSLKPGARHIMIHSLSRPVSAGDSVEFKLTFAKAGEILTKAAVITYADVDTATAPIKR